MRSCPIPWGCEAEGEGERTRVRERGREREGEILHSCKRGRGGELAAAVHTLSRAGRRALCVGWVALLAQREREGRGETESASETDTETDRQRGRRGRRKSM